MSWLFNMIKLIWNVDLRTLIHFAALLHFYFVQKIYFTAKIFIMLIISMGLICMQLYVEAYLEPSSTSAVELLWENYKKA